MVLLNYDIQVFVGPDELLSGQYAFGLQFGDGLMRRLTTVGLHDKKMIEMATAEESGLLRRKLGNAEGYP